MQSAQESKNELQAAIRYAENAISAAQATIESIDFRQEMAKKDYMEKTGHEEALTKLVKELEELNEKLVVDNSNLEREVAELRDIIDRMSDDATGDSVTIRQQRERIDELEDKVQGQYDDIKMLEAENAKFRKEKEASSAPCGCQAYHDLEEARGRAEGEVELLQSTIADLEAQVNALEQPEHPTMPVIPKDVAIAIFREGVRSGVRDAIAELEGQTINVSESEYVGDFEVSFTRDIHLDDELDFDWMRDKVGQYNKEFVVDALKGLCADKEFECRIHGINDAD
jgi:hypothetical protein